MRRLVRWALVAVLLVPAAARAQSGTIDASDEAVTYAPPLMADSVRVTLGGSFSDSIAFQFEGGTGWRTLTCVDAAGATSATSATTAGEFVCPNPGFGQLRMLGDSSWIGSAATVMFRAGGGSSLFGMVNLTQFTFSTGRLKVLADINNGGALTDGNNARVEGCLPVGDDFSGCDPVMVTSRADTSTATITADTGTSTAILAANASRLGAKCLNDSPAVLLINYGAAASTADHIERVEPGGTWFMEAPIYTGAINGIWAADANGSARCRDLTQ